MIIGVNLRVISKQIRDAAKGQDCTLRLTGCSYDPDRTVGAHVPCGQNGMGMKSPDTMIIFADDCCHSLIDGPRRNEFLPDIFRALTETHFILIDRGLLIVKGMK